MQSIDTEPRCVASWIQPESESLIRTILHLACAGLLQMFIPEQQLFCHVLRQHSNGQMLREGVSYRYTMMTLLGLHRFEETGQRSPVPIGPVLDELARDLSWISSCGDLGVLLWLFAVVSPDRLSDIFSRVRLGAATRSFKDGRQRSTTELAWLLAGLAHAKLAQGERSGDLDSVAFETYKLLIANQGASGIFGHSSKNFSVSGRLRGSIGTFADQVYPIYALSHFGEAFGDSQAILRARDCANVIVRLQGAQGEWWWHYDSMTGSVTRPYPVYSVHQDGMAPMALLALSRVDEGSDFSSAIERGLGWIAGTNAMNREMRDADRKLIWRSIALGSNIPAVQELIHLVTGRSPRQTIYRPRIVHECRPYELGWALYSLTGYLQNPGSAFGPQATEARA